MLLLWISLVHLNFIRTNAQFNLHGLQYRLLHRQQVTENPISFPYYQQSHPKILMPIYESNSNIYQTPFPIYAQQPVPTFTVQTASHHTPLFANQQEYAEYVTEMGKNDVMNSISKPMEYDYSNSVDAKPNLADILRGASDEMQRNFYKIVSNPDESFQQKQNKLDQLILSLDSKNQEFYNNYRRMKELEEREKRERVHAVVSSMSQKAQAVFAKLSAVLMDPTMKDIDRINKINGFYKNVDDDVKNEFKDKISDLNWQL